MNIRFSPRSLHVGCCLLALALAIPAVANETLESVVRPEHRKALMGAESKLDTAARGFVKDRDEETAAAAKALLALLELPRGKAPSPKALVGKWKVRSLQASERGVYAYPFFDCEFRAEGREGVVFHKDKGSQRRIGLIGKGENGHVIFVGGSYYSDESPAGYSALQDAGAKAGSARDSVGHVFQIKSNHLIIVFAPTAYGSEIYELKKP